MTKKLAETKDESSGDEIQGYCHDTNHKPDIKVQKSVVFEVTRCIKKTHVEGKTANKFIDRNENEKSLRSDTSI